MATAVASHEAMPLEASHPRKSGRKEKRGKRHDHPAEPEESDEVTSTTSSTSTSTSAAPPAVGSKRPLEEAEQPEPKRATAFDRLTNLENEIVLFFDEELQRLGIVEETFADVPNLPPGFAARVREAFAWLYGIKGKKPDEVRALLAPDSPHPFVALSPQGIQAWWKVTCSKPQPKAGSPNNYQCWTEITYGPQRKADKFKGRPWFYLPPMVLWGMRLTDIGWPSAKENVVGEKGKECNLKPEENLYHLRLDVEHPDNPGYNERHRLMGLFGSIQSKRLFRHLMYQLFLNPLFQPITKRNVLYSYLTSQMCDELKLTQRDGKFYVAVGKDEEEEVTHLHDLVREGCFEKFRTEVTTCTWGETKEIEEETVRDCKGWARPEKTDLVLKCPVFVAYDKDEKKAEKKPDPNEPKEPWPSDGFPLKEDESERVKRCVRQHKKKFYCPLVFRKPNGKIAGTNDNLVAPVTPAADGAAAPAPPADGTAAPKFFWTSSGNVIMPKVFIKIYSLKKHPPEWGMSMRFKPEIRILTQRELGSLKSNNVALAGEENIHLLQTKFEEEVESEQQMGGFDHED